MSDCRRQAFIDAPVDVVWGLVRDVNRHPEWWPKVVEVECEGLEEGCTYRQVTQTPFGYQELDVVVDRLEELRELRIRCVNTGTFVDIALTPAGTGTFVDARFGMEPLTARTRIFDAVAGKRYFRRWLEQSLDAMQRVAREQTAEVSAPSGSQQPPVLETQQERSPEAQLAQEIERIGRGPVLDDLTTLETADHDPPQADSPTTVCAVKGPARGDAIALR